MELSVCLTCHAAVCCPCMETRLHVTCLSTTGPRYREVSACVECKCSQRPVALFTSLIFIPQSIFMLQDLITNWLVLSINVLNTLHVINIHSPINIQKCEAAACAERKCSRHPKRH